MIPWWAVLPIIQGVVTVAVLAILYGLLLRRLTTIVEPYRFQLAERGEKYLVICDNPKEKNQIKFYLDNAFNPWVAVAACFLVWLALFMVAIKSRPNGFDPKDEREYAQICKLFTVSIFVSNPLFGTIAVIEISVVALVVVLIAGNAALIKRALVLMIEAQAQRNNGLHLHAH
jgi:hypothetical protein